MSEDQPKTSGKTSFIQFGQTGMALPGEFFVAVHFEERVMGG